MTLKWKLIISVLILILNLTSGDSGCEDTGKHIAFRPKDVPKYSRATRDGYSVDWYSGIMNKEFDGWSTCPDKVTLYYNGPPGVPCCYGYQEVSVSPKTEGVDPFFLPDICGEKSQGPAFITVSVWGKEWKRMEIAFKNVKPCKKEDIVIGGHSLDRDILIPAIIGGAVLVLIIVLIYFVVILKKNGNNEDDESPENYDEEPADYDEDGGSSSYYDEESEDSRHRSRSRSRR